MQRVQSVNAKRFVRKMRGSAQAHLLECDDGSFYVVKFSNNPQGGRRVLDMRPDFRHNRLVRSLRKAYFRVRL